MALALSIAGGSAVGLSAAGAHKTFQPAIPREYVTGEIVAIAVPENRATSETASPLGRNQAPCEAD